jgi:phage/plasmid-associated DNA primase
MTRLSAQDRVLLAEYRRTHDPRYKFFADCLITDEAAITPLPDIRDAARKWCADNNVREFTDTALGRVLSDNGGRKGRSSYDRNGKRTRLWLGIALKLEQFR